MSFETSPPKDWIDSWGGWWLYRWGDAAIRAVQLWVMLEVPGGFNGAVGWLSLDKLTRSNKKWGVRRETVVAVNLKLKVHGNQ